MNCNEARPYLLEYYDGECTAEIRDAIRVHLDTCAACTGTLAEWSRVAQTAFSRRQVKAPPFLWTRVLAGIEELEQKQAVWWAQLGWMGRITATVAVLVFLGAGFVFYNSSSGSPLESLFVGQAGSPHTLQLSSRPNQTEVTAWVLSLDTESPDDSEARI